MNLHFGREGTSRNSIFIESEGIMNALQLGLKKWVLILAIPFILLFGMNSLVYGEWTSISPPSVSSDWELRRVRFTSPNDGWAMGNDYTNQRGVLLHYSGGTWTPVSAPSVSSDWFLLEAHFTSLNEVIINLPNIPFFSGLQSPTPTYFPACSRISLMTLVGTPSSLRII